MNQEKQKKFLKNLKKCLPKRKNSLHLLKQNEKQMKNANKKFNKLVKHFQIAYKETVHEVEIDYNNEGRLNKEDLLIIYNKLEEETEIVFEIDYTAHYEDDGDGWETPYSKTLISEHLEVEITTVFYAGIEINLTNKQLAVLGKLIEDSIVIE